MNTVIIGAPFGNYLDFPGATRTFGTYTLERRAGALRRWWRVLSTVRYYPGIGAWKNKLGLPNPGIAALERRRYAAHRCILSISARHTDAWLELIDRAAALGPEAIELNVSCPNVGDEDASDYAEVFRCAAAQPLPCILKLPPVNYRGPLWLALDNGISAFHCCNTLPTGNGGLSGKPLKALSLACVREVARSKPTILIGGGGITTVADAREYLEAGPTNVALASMLFNPLNWRTAREIIASVSSGAACSASS